MTRERMLEEARRCVCGQREQNYGSPEDVFGMIAKLWSVYLETTIGPEDVAIMMIMLKIARLTGSEYQSEDSWVDIAGYAACGAEIATKGINCSDQR